MTIDFTSRYTSMICGVEKFLKIRRIGGISWNTLHLRCIANSTSYPQLTPLLTLKAGQFFCWRLSSEAMP